MTNKIFPVSIYAALAFYVAAGPVSHVLGSKTFVVFGALCKLATRMILIWGGAALQYSLVFLQLNFSVTPASL